MAERRVRAEVTNGRIGAADAGRVAGAVEGLGRGVSCGGYGLHAGRRYRRRTGSGWSVLLHYVPPAAAREGRMEELPDGQVRWTMRRPWSDGTTGFSSSPLELTERLAAYLVPRRVHTVHYHGVFAPRSSWPADVVLGPEEVRKHPVWSTASLWSGRGRSLRYGSAPGVSSGGGGDGAPGARGRSCWNGSSRQGERDARTAEARCRCTLDHLLTHTSPIVDRASVWSDLYFPGDAPISLGAFLEGYLVEGGEDYQMSNWSNDPPGTRYSYCDIGAALAAYVVESATGMDFADHTAASVFTPLGMANTGWRVADFPADTVAIPHATSNGERFEPYGLYGYPDYPDGLLKSSVNDLATFMTLFTSGTGGGVLTPASVESLFEEPFPDVVSTQGRILYGLPTPLGTWWGHGGDDYGVATAFRFDRETGIGVIVLLNADWHDESAVLGMENLLFTAAPYL